jgi:heterodisulfide reductase subunit B
MGMIEDEIARLMQKCISCGKCTPYCPASKYGGVDPHEIMIGGETDVTTCILCGTCSQVCRRSDPFTVMRDLKALANDLHVSKTYLDTGYAMGKSDHPSRKELVCDWDGDDVLIMPGCVVECKAPFLEYSAMTAVKLLGKTCSELEGSGCCLRPPQFREMQETERHDRIVRMTENAKGKDIVTLCGGCTDALRSNGEENLNMIDLLHDNLDKLPKFERRFKVAIEPGCSCMPQKKDMAEIVEALGCEFVNNGMGCCGKDTVLAETMMADREKECGNGCLIVVACPKCFTKYDAQPGGMPVLFLPELVAWAAGHTETFKYHNIPIEPDREDFYKPRFEGFIPKESKGMRW